MNNNQPQASVRMQVIDEILKDRLLRELLHLTETQLSHVKKYILDIEKSKNTEHSSR